MTVVARFLSAGFAGAAATNLTHEVLRRIVPSSPRVDLLGMQALANMYRAVDADPPRGRTLYVKTLIGDLALNSAYFALSGLGGRNALNVGVAIGTAAGIGAFLIPRRVGLDDMTTARTTTTKLPRLEHLLRSRLASHVKKKPANRSPAFCR